VWPCGARGSGGAHGGMVPLAARVSGWPAQGVIMSARKKSAPVRTQERRPKTEDERLLTREAERVVTPEAIYKDAWRVFRIMGEFVEGFDTLMDLGPAVSFFGSARIGRDDPMYAAAQETARRLAEAGFAVIT